MQVELKQRIFDEFIEMKEKQENIHNVTHSIFHRSRSCINKNGRY